MLFATNRAEPAIYFVRQVRNAPQMKRKAADPYKSGVLNYAEMKSVRTLLLWLLMLTSPVQGFAAVLRSSCGTENQSSLAVENSTLHVDSDNALHDQVIDAGVNVAPTSRRSHDDSAGTSHHHHQHHDHKNMFCGSCGSCCVGAFAMMSMQSWTPEFHQAAVQIIAPSPLVTGYFPNGLERPPRLASF